MENSADAHSSGDAQILNCVYIILGGNVGDVKATLKQAFLLIEEKVGLVQQISKLYQTAAWGNTNQADFINVAASVSTPLSAIDCLNTLLQIETALGRIRTEKWGARTIDIDILYFNEDIIQTSNLTVPHPELRNRKFVLVPLCEIAPTYIHPVLKLSNSELMTQLNDDLLVWLYSNDGNGDN